MENWKPIKGFEGSYLVSNLGAIKSTPRKRKAGWTSYVTKETLLKTEFNNRGYLRVCLSVDGLRKRLLIHRVIAETFIPNPDNLPVINHINGIKTDNRIENLEWVTTSKNNLHAYATKLKIPYNRDGEFNPKNKLTNEQVIGIKQRIKQGKSYIEIIDGLPISKSSISDIKYGRTWSWL